VKTQKPIKGLWISDISLTMNDLKTVATILFRVFGASDIVFAVVYWPYNLLISHYTS
jgi:hypothetical protein